MTMQITVRLPDENVAWLDAEVAAGRFPSRTAGLAKLLGRAQRRQEDEADMLTILANPDPDEASRLEWMRTRHYPPIDDDLSYDDTAAEPDPGVTAKAATAGGRRAFRASMTGKKHYGTMTTGAAAAAKRGKRAKANGTTIK